MKFHISDYPSSYIVISLQKDEKLITEKGAMICCDGEYQFENKLEIQSYKNWIAKLFGGKSLSYNIYTALEDLKITLAPKDSAEIFSMPITPENPILFEPNLHFARTTGVRLALDKRNLKSTLNDGLKLKATGTGTLFLKGYGRIIHQSVDTEKPIYIDEQALIAFEESLEIKTISKGLKELVTSGEGFLFSVKGKGNIWLQSREKTTNGNRGGAIDGAFSLLK